MLISMTMIIIVIDDHINDDDDDTFNRSTYSFNIADLVVLFVLLVNDSVLPPTVDFLNAFGAFGSNNNGNNNNNSSSNDKMLPLA